MTNSHYLQTTLGRIGLGLLMGLFLFASSGWGAVVHAQVADVGIGEPSRGGLGDKLKRAYGEALVDTGENLEEGLNEALDDAVSETGGTGNPLIDGALQGAASALAGALSLWDYRWDWSAGWWRFSSSWLGGASE